MAIANSLSFPSSSQRLLEQLQGGAVGLIAGNGSFPRRFIEEAKNNNCRVCAVCFTGETDEGVAALADNAVWTKVGELGKMIATFKSHSLRYVAMAGGISRVKLFGGVKLDARGAALIFRLRSTKDDVVMRGIAEELQKEGIEVIDCTIFLRQCLASEGVLTRHRPSPAQTKDIEVGIAAIRAMSSQDIGQLVVVRDGVIVAVEAVEGSDEAIRRGGKLGGKGVVVVKFAKVTQDMRFDVPTVGPGTIRSMVEVGAGVLAVEAQRCLLLDREETLQLANKHKIAIIGCRGLTADGR